MDFLTVASVAKGGVMRKSGNLPDLMAKGGVTIRALDLVIGYVFLVHELRRILGAQNHGLVMALNAFPFRDMGISLNDVKMTLFAGYPSGDVLAVIEAPPFNLNISLGLDMAGSASADGT